MLTKLKTPARLALGTLMGAFLCQSGMFTINAIWDNTITGDPNHAAIEGAIDTAITTIESSFSNPLTVSIYFQEGGGLGQSNFTVYDEPYTSFYSGLKANNSNPAAIAALQAAGYTSVNPVGGKNEIEMKSANARAVGIDVPPGCDVTAVTPSAANGNIPNDCGNSAHGALVDGIVSLNTLLTTPGTGSGDGYDLVSTAEHEIDEILGLGSALENCDMGASGQSGACNSGTLTLANDTSFKVGAPEDLYRYTAATGGTLADLTVTCGSPGSAYFGYGANTGALAQFNNACNGGDFGDWNSMPQPANPQVQDAFAYPNTAPGYGANEIAALSAIGYDPTPEPGTITLLGTGLALLAAMGRRRHRRD